jgi:hypothetical protein
VPTITIMVATLEFVKEATIQFQHWEKPSSGTIKVNTDANLYREDMWGLRSCLPR